jgi:hypothetical protein
MRLDTSPPIWATTSYFADALTKLVNLWPKIREALNKPGRTEVVRKIAARFGVDPSAVQRIRLAALSKAQASPAHNDREARPPATQVELGYRLCLLIEVKQTTMLQCGNRRF